MLVVFAGPNGSGNTTLARAMLQAGWLVGFEYLNPDNVAHRVYGDWNNPAAASKAGRMKWGGPFHHLNALFKFPGPPPAVVVWKGVDLY